MPNTLRSKIIKSVILVYSIVLCGTSYGQIKIINPILSGFYPDPSIVKVGNDYYLINSTFGYFPGIPVFHSKDLKNWKQIGNVIDRPSQMNFLGQKLTGGLFAPGISYFNGQYYVTCTNVGRGNFVVTAQDPAGPWSDPVYLPEVKGIDPSIFFDTDKAYIVYNSDAPEGKPLYSGHRTIRSYVFDPVKLKVTGEVHILVNGGSDISKKPVWIEGPHLLKKGDWYYLYAAEGGTGPNHSEVVFRSTSPEGPFVPYENNPILTQRTLPAGRLNPITSAGHAQLVEGPDGKTYAVFLAVRPYADDYYNTGRETFVAPVNWVQDWPVVATGNEGVQYNYKFDFKEAPQKNTLPQSGNFEYVLKFKESLDPGLLFLRTKDSGSYSINPAKGLNLKLKPETCSGFGSPSFIGKRQQHQNCEAEVPLTFSTNEENEKAGLCILQDEKHYYFLCKSSHDGKPVVQIYKSGVQTMEPELLAQAALPEKAANVDLKIQVTGDRCSFDFKTAGGQWISLKNDVDGKFLSTHVAGGFIGCIFGMYATSNGKPSGNSAAFRSLRYSGNDPAYQK